MASDLTNEALKGYSASESKCPYLYSSPSAIAWHVGKWLNDTGRSSPRRVRMSRGFQMHVNDMLVLWRDDNSIERIH